MSTFKDPIVWIYWALMFLAGIVMGEDTTFGVAGAVIVLSFFVGYLIDTVPNRSVGSKSERGKAPSTDLREVAWISDPIETRVVREPKQPMPGTTGDLHPDPPRYLRFKQDMAVVKKDGSSLLVKEGDIIYVSSLDQVVVQNLLMLPAAAEPLSSIPRIEPRGLWQIMPHQQQQLGWSTEGRHAGFRAGGHIDGLPIGGCAICGIDLYGPERVCSDCFAQRAGT